MDSRKTPNARIENETRQQVTFSERRTKLFKKVCEIGTLCGAETAVVINSPAGKLHSFGYPNVETVAHKFLNLKNINVSIVIAWPTSQEVLIE
ncbi:agamous-like mads-box protein agl61 [Phtheirospermum japonicum]|uniref:Agamous-like mads-box protein agl61 n=1 Tax=Phtheirospermum japonicum TaxID=374723 RepID=A0A830D9G2_9LAMI|nr:agamous-like mads-box protein agl61 [Phtheirospermum japonicum]